MADLGFGGITTFLFTIIAIVGLVTLASVEVKPQKEQTARYLKKILWGMLIISASYWYLTIPYVGSYYKFSGNLEYPSNLIAEEETKYIKDHHTRIENLEEELKETKEELAAIREHYEMIIHFLFYAILYYGVNQIFKSKNKGSNKANKEEIQKI